MNTERRDQIAKWLHEQGIEARPSFTCVAVNRTSMCVSKFKSPGIPEEGTYPAVLQAIQKEFGGEGMTRLSWWGKTDEDLFLDTLGGD